MTHRIGYAILLDEAGHNAAREIELDLSMRFQTRAGLKQSPHITVKPPFVVEELDPFVDYFDTLAADTKQFDIEVRGFDYFEPKVIFLNVAENAALAALHRKIVADLERDHGIAHDARTEMENVRFHSTVATGDLTPENFAKAKEYVAGKHPSFAFRASRMALFYQLSPEEGWIVYRQAELKGA